MTKWKSNLKSKNIYNVSSYYGKNWKLITKNYLIIVIVIIEIIMLMNKDNNK